MGRNGLYYRIHLDDVAMLRALPAETLRDLLLFQCVKYIEQNEIDGDIEIKDPAEIMAFIQLKASLDDTISVRQAKIQGGRNSAEARKQQAEKKKAQDKGG